MLRFRALSCVLALLASGLLAPARAQSVAWRIPADFERHPALLLGAAQMMFHHHQTFVDIASAMQGHARLYGLVSNAAQARHLRRLLTENGLPADAVLPIVVPVQSMWLRDYGPVFVQDARGEVGIVDARYGGTAANPDDEAVPRELAEEWDAPFVASDLWLEGGQILSNGAGLLLVSTSLFSKNALRDGIDGQRATARLQQTLPFERAEVVQPMHGEPTGHLDMFLAFLAPDLLLVARIDAAADPVNAARLDAIADRFEGTDSGSGALRVVRVETPAATDGIWRTYTNAAMAADTVLVPSYRDVDAHFDADAIALYERLMPDRRIVAIDATTLVAKRGALHCVSMPVPSDAPAMDARSQGPGAQPLPFFETGTP